MNNYISNKLAVTFPKMSLCAWPLGGAWLKTYIIVTITNWKPVFCFVFYSGSVLSDHYRIVVLFLHLRNVHFLLRRSKKSRASCQKTFVFIQTFLPVPPMPGCVLCEHAAWVPVPVPETWKCVFPLSPFGFSSSVSEQPACCISGSALVFH